MPSRSSYLTRPEKEVPRLKSSRVAENSMYPSAGPRLGVFNIPTPDTNLMPPAPPNVAEVYMYMYMYTENHKLICISIYIHCQLNTQTHTTVIIMLCNVCLHMHVERVC